ncbi:hypothetical protein PR202_ga03912 [Eleusine coracana subsp. coracana]|uniref:Prolamin-like domain-containing protein n=1 Tax=Eleusine coracana subsp. coracana TaxID=191504 RepID=A0AAV5BPT4_ELECO|nr:hypothetical protein PR202_ga03912 [Eleusine coracana subsp. coracana]
MAVLTILLLLVAVVTAAPAPAPVAPLDARLRHAFSLNGGDQQDGGGGGGIVECWGALAQLGSCTSEIFLFLVNGNSYIGPECCRAIRGATLHCWPAMLASVGFTAEQADVLQGFCDGEEAAAAQQHGAPPPAGKQ